MKHVDMLMILKRANDETLRLWSEEHARVERNPKNRIAKHKESTYWAQLEELRGMIIAEEKKIERLKVQSTANQ